MIPIKTFFFILFLQLFLFFPKSTIAEENTQNLTIVRPNNNTKTYSNKISFLGSAPKDKDVTINTYTAKRSASGHFAYVVPLNISHNLFTVKWGDEENKINVTRLSSTPKPLKKLSFTKNSLKPSYDISVISGEIIHFSAMAPPNTTVTVSLGEKTINLVEENPTENQSSNYPVTPVIYKGYFETKTPIKELRPIFQITQDEKTVTKKGTGKITVLDKNDIEPITIIAKEGVVRTGPGTNYGRLTPLPKGTKDYVLGKYGRWIHLKFGGWIKKEEVAGIKEYLPSTAAITGISSGISSPSELKVKFYLNTPTPFSIQQQDRQLKIKFFNASHQSDSIRVDTNNYLSRIEWIPKEFSHTEYVLHFLADQQWGYTAEYDNSTLILTLKRPPNLQAINDPQTPLKGLSILLDPGHGGKDAGALGPTGYEEKQATLQTAIFFKEELTKRGATVYMTRETDTFISLNKRIEILEQKKPTLCISIHYNSNPLSTDPFESKGLSIHWYQPQTHALAQFIHDYVIEKMHRKSHGVIWQTLKMIRPTIAPSVLLELGFMSHPEEFDEITNPAFQKEMAATLANALVEWFKTIKQS